MLVGCPRETNSISRVSRPFNPLPDFNCIARAVASVDGVSSVELSTEQGGRQLTFSGLQRPEIIYRYNYLHAGASNNGNLYFVVDYRDQSTLRQIHTCDRCPKGFFALKRSVMLNLEKAMQQTCSLPDLTEITNEFCNGLGCSGT
jgi:hypothetical protein